VSVDGRASIGQLLAFFCRIVDIDEDDSLGMARPNISMNQYSCCVGNKGSQSNEECPRVGSFIHIRLNTVCSYSQPCPDS
jgi:hypothetical protein